MPFKFRPRSQEFQNNPHESFDIMREENPIYFTNNNYVILTRYDHVAETLKNPKSSVDYMTYCEGAAAEYVRPIKEIREKSGVFGNFNTMIRSDEPSHGRMKHLTLPHFTQKNLAGLASKIHEIVSQRIDEIKPGEEIDAAQMVTQHIPIDTIFHVLDLPYKDKEMLTKWAHDLTLILEPLQSSSDGIESVMKIFPDTMLYLVELIEARRKNPRENDVVSDLLTGTIDGSPLTYEEIVSTVGLLYMAGIETTVFFLSNALNALLSSEKARSDWMDIVTRAKRESETYYLDKTALNAMDELMRFCGSVWMTARVNTEPFSYDVDGTEVTVPRGSLINVFMAAANRDPRVFENPHTLDLYRHNASKQLGFSHGPHYCLGAHLAKMEALILFAEIFEKFPDIQLSREPVWRHRLTFRGIENLYVRA